jgi:hypothetical protein
MDANPIGIIVLAIAAVIAGVVLMYNKFSWFRDFVKGFGLDSSSPYSTARRRLSAGSSIRSNGW